MKVSTFPTLNAVCNIKYIFQSCVLCQTTLRRLELKECLHLVMVGININTSAITNTECQYLIFRIETVIVFTKKNWSYETNKL